MPAPKYEVRAVWIATAAGLDWPRSRDRNEQQASLRSMVRRLKAAHFNTIFFQARARGDAYYRSSFEPWAENLTGTLGKDPGWDPLQFLLNEAHALGMEVHAWFNVYKIRGPGNNIPSTTPPHPARAFPQWTVPAEGELWFDPGIPDVRDYTLKVALDLIAGYDIDGIQFDFIRYPGRDFPDDKSYRRYGNGIDRAEWRRANIDAFVTALYDSATARKPMLKVGSAPLGVFSAGNGKNGWGAFHSYYQDAPGWLRKKKHDYLVPQIYWDIGESKGDPDFIALAQSWQEMAAGRHVYAGIAAYKSAVLEQIPEQIDAAREKSTVGQAYFRYENISTMDMFDERYATPALIPPMPWKGGPTPTPPSTVAVTESHPNIFQVEWTSPPDEHRTHLYAIYRWHVPEIPTDDVRALVATVPAPVRSYVDTLSGPHGIRQYYAVTAIDRANNESRPSIPAPVVIREMVDLHYRLSAPTRLATLMVDDWAGSPLIAYRLAERSDVSLDILSLADPRGFARHMVDSIQQAGTYIVSAGSAALPPGRYAVRLRFSGATLEQHIEVKR
ncbi:MAG: family 10 glycosylhydrolase [Bacteroidota bacterium]